VALLLHKEEHTTILLPSCLSLNDLHGKSRMLYCAGCMCAGGGDSIVQECLDLWGETKSLCHPEGKSQTLTHEPTCSVKSITQLTDNTSLIRPPQENSGLYLWFARVVMPKITTSNRYTTVKILGIRNIFDVFESWCSPRLHLFN